MDVSFTTFLNFVAAEYTAKITTVSDAKARYGQDYDPAADYWKGARETILQAAEENESIDLERALRRYSAKKTDNYRSAIGGFARWAKRDRVEWVRRPRPRDWTSGNLTVKVNPELEVLVRGVPHVVKLYLRLDDKLTPRRLQVALHLLAKLYRQDGMRVAVFDARRSKLITAPARPARHIDAFLAGEASMFATIWSELDSTMARS